MIGMRQYREMESSDMSASPAGEAGHATVAGESGERETNASSQLTAPEATGRRETKEPCPMETTESAGARETTVPEERSAALRRDGEPLTSAAKRRRQTETETDAEEPQMDAGERPPSPVREDEEEPPPLAEDPAGQQVTDPITLADHMVRMCEEEVLDWMRTRTVHPGPDADPDPAGSPTGQELVDDLEKVLAKEEAERYPPPGSKEDAWMMKVLEQATKVHCFAEEICNETTKEDWQLCPYQLYRWQMDQDVGHLYALFGGPEEDEVRVKGQRLAKRWMDKAVDSVERVRRCVGLRFQGTSGLDEPRQYRHDGPPMESRPCEIQARTATRRADRAWRRGPRRVKELCGRLPGGAGEPDRDSAPAEAPDGGSEFSPGSSDSESDKDCFESCEPRSPDPEEDPKPSGAESEKFRPLEARPEGSESSESSESESEDSDSSEAESGESYPFDMEARRRGPLTSSSSDSDSSSASSDSKESDSSSADSGFVKPS